MATKTRRPRYRKHRRHSRNLRDFLADMAEKWSGEETEIDVDAVGSDVLALGDTPDVAGPFTLRGAPPVGFPRNADNTAKPFWIAVDESDNATVYTSRNALAAQRGAVELASWDLSPDMTSLTGVAAAINTTDAGTTVATLGTPLAISAVTNGADTLTRVGHGFAVDDGPYYIAQSGGAVPGGLAATTPYWIAAIPTADTFKLAASLGGAAINLTDDGSGTLTLVPVNIDLSLNVLKKTAHGLTTGQLVRVSTDGALPTGLLAATNYWAIAVSANVLAFASSLANANAGTKIDLTATGSGTTTVVLCNIDTTLDTYHAVAHGFATGDGPVRATTGTTLPTGVAAATDYWIVRVDADNLKLADTEAHALAGTNIIDITAIGAGTQTITLAGADVTEDSLRVVAHGMATGDGPVQVSTNGALPTGLLAATDYYVIRLSADYFALATSRANALAGTKINLTGIGSGTHQLVRALTIGKDLSADGLLQWLAQGVTQQAMRESDVADVDVVFAA